MSVTEGAAHAIATGLVEPELHWLTGSASGLMRLESTLGLMGEGCKQLFRIINNHANNTPSLGFADDYNHGLLTHGCAAALARGNHKALEAGRVQWSRQGCSGHYAAGRLKSHLGAEDGSD